MHERGSGRRDENALPIWKRVARASWVGLAVGGVASGCDDSGTGADEVAASYADVSEHAEVRTHEGIPEDIPQWTIADSADRRLGTLDEPSQAFGRVVGFVERSDGSIVVADGFSEQILAFDRAGRPLWTAGGAGGGPGEFRQLSGLLLLPGDSVMGFERASPRMVAFGPNGEFAWEMKPERMGGGLSRPQVEGVLSDGAIVARAGSTFESRRSETGFVRWPDVLVYYSPEERVLQEVGRFPGRELIFESAAPGRFAAPRVPYGRELEIAVGHSRVAVTTQDRFEVILYGLAGTPELVIRVNQTPAPINRDGWREYIESRRVPRRLRMPPEVERTQRKLADRGAPDIVPAVDRIEIDAAGRLWVQEYGAPFERRTPIWWVFSPEGDPIAVVKAPTRFVIHQIKEDHVVGLTHGEFNEPYVEVRKILRDG